MQNFPFVETAQDQFSLADILATRIQMYPLLQQPSFAPLAPEADFLYFPFFSVIHSKAWPCNSTSYDTFDAAINATIADVLALVASLPPSTYPRLILPIGNIQAGQNTGLLTVEHMKLLDPHVVLVGIETEPYWIEQGITTRVQLPYPSRFHLPQGKEVDEDYFLNRERPFL